MMTLLIAQSISRLHQMETNKRNMTAWMFKKDRSPELLPLVSRKVTIEPASPTKLVDASAVPVLPCCA